MAGRQRAVEVPIRGEVIELHQFLKLAGVVESGGAGKALVATGGVKVEGVAETRKTRKLRPGNLVEVQGARLRVVALPGEPPESGR